MAGSELVDEDVLLLGPWVREPGGLVTTGHPDQLVSQHVAVHELAGGGGVLGALHLETELQRVALRPRLRAPLGAGVGELPEIIITTITITIIRWLPPCSPMCLSTRSSSWQPPKQASCSPPSTPRTPQAGRIRRREKYAFNYSPT